MSYYARGSGELKLHEKIPDDVIERLKGFDDADQYVRNHKSGKRVWYLFLNHSDDRYDSVLVENDLDEIAPFVSEGSIEFTGEDGGIWRYRFDNRTSRFVEDCGWITYDNDPVKKYTGGKLDFLNAIIEVFETFLDEKGIVIENDEKLQDEYASNIYGTDYGDLESELESLLIKCNVLEADSQ